MLATVSMQSAPGNLSATARILVSSAKTASIPWGSTSDGVVEDELLEDESLCFFAFFRETTLCAFA